MESTALKKMAGQDTISTLDNSSLDTASEPFIGKWRKLVSISNWDKGRIIHEWRSALIAAEVPTTEYSDEAWASRVGGVTGQHAGRLRRVFDRFDELRDKFNGLYWSHFQAALDWEDAEMWLEGSVQNRWSVSLMRRQRWETMGAIKDDEPVDSDIVEAEIDEDFDASADKGEPKDFSGDDYSGPRPEGPDFGDEDEPDSLGSSRKDNDDDGDLERTELVRPFANLAKLPDDFRDAFEGFKIAILRHKTGGWADLSLDDALGSLESLKLLALAPSASTHS